MALTVASFGWLVNLKYLDIWMKTIERKYPHAKTRLNRVEGMKAIYRFLISILG